MPISIAIYISNYVKGDNQAIACYSYIIHIYSCPCIISICRRTGKSCYDLNIAKISKAIITWISLDIS